MKRKLVQYKGGGYDGCFWEWNFFLSDKGKFKDVFSSGRFGIDSPKKLRNFEDDYSGYCVYDLDDKDSMRELATQINVVQLAGLIKTINGELVEDSPISGICKLCEKVVDNYDDINLESWHGCGGIASTADDLICSECYSMHTCDVCNEYSPEDLTYDDERDEAVCGYCLDEREAEDLAGLKEELVHQVFASGSPDLFDDSMRWFWGNADITVEEIEALLVA